MANRSLIVYRTKSNHVVRIFGIAVVLILTLSSQTTAMPDETQQGSNLISDFGDAPPPYQTIMADGGARHRVGSTQLTLYMGAGVDAEPDGQPHPLALGDDLAGSADEDGVFFPEPLVQCTTVRARVTVVGSGKLNAWIDFDRDGSWAGMAEKIASDVSLSTGIHNLLFTVPCTAVSGESFARFRYDSEGGLTYWNPTDYVPDGEVEDHAVTIGAPSLADVSIALDDEPDPVHAGNQLNYLASIHNLGPDGATNVVSSILLPVGSESIGVMPSRGICSVTPGGDGNPEEIVCALGDLPTGEVIEIDILTLTAHDAIGPLSASATVSADEIDPDTSNNEDVETTDVLAAENWDYGDAPSGYPVTIAETGARHFRDLGGPRLGELIDYEPDGVSSAGADSDDETFSGVGKHDDEDGVSFTQHLIRGLGSAIDVDVKKAGVLNAWLDFDGTPGWDDADERIIVDVDLGVGSHLVPVTIPASAVLGETVARFRFASSSVSVTTGDAPDGEVEDYLVEVHEQRLDIEKRASEDPMLVGEELTYTLTVSNDDDVTATNVSMRDTLPVGFVYQSYTSSKGTCNHLDGVVTCALGDLAPREVVTMSITVKIESVVERNASPTVFVNTADVLRGEDVEDTDIAETTVYAPCCTDVVLVIDRSNSMTGLNLTAAVDAAMAMLDVLDISDDPAKQEENCNQVGLVSFGSTATLDQELTKSRSDLVAALSGLSGRTEPNTNIGHGLSEARLEMESGTNRDPKNIPIIILLSDGANGCGDALPCPNPEEEAKAIKAAGFRLITIGLGRLTSWHRDMLRRWASAPRHFYHSPTPEELEAIFVNIANDTCPGGGGAPDGDIGVTKTAIPDPAIVCNNITYTVIVTNHGTEAATNVKLVDTLPLGTLLDIDPTTLSPAGECAYSEAASPPTITCTWTSVEPGDANKKTVTYTGKVEEAALPPPSQLVNTAVVTSDVTEPDPDPHPNTQTLTVMVQSVPADLSLTKSLLAGQENPVRSGDSVVYEISVSNAGPDTAEAVVVVDTLPVGLTLVPAGPTSQTDASCALAPAPAPAGTVDCALGDMINGAGRTILIEASVDCGVAPTLPSPPGMPLVNSAEVRYKYRECNPANNTDTAEIDVEGGFDLSIEKDDDTDPVFGGGMFKYILTVKNRGRNVVDVIVEDLLPKHLTFVTVEDSVTGFGVPAAACTTTADPDGTMLTCTYPLVTCAPIRIEVTMLAAVESAHCGLVTNTATVRDLDPGDDDDPTNNEDDEETLIFNEAFCAELGDAPTSYNSSGAPMQAYPAALPGLLATFPTVFQPIGGWPPGPKHLDAKSDAWLGPEVSAELEADFGMDEDDRNNIDPPVDLPDQDGYDDGVDPLSVAIPSCGATLFTYTVTVPAWSGAPERQRFVNVWFDFNRDGDWNDTLVCTTAAGTVLSVPEWAVRNDPSALGVGTHHLSTPLFAGTLPPDPSQPMWMRISLAEQVAPFPGDGRGPTSMYAFGETEDYLLTSGGGSAFAHRITPPSVQQALGIIERGRPLPR